MICFPWTVNWKGQGQDIAEFPYFARWHNELAARSAVQRGLAAGAELPEDPATLSQEERDRRAALLYNQRALPAPEGGLLLIPPG
jgi:GST-like protein